MTNGVSPQQKLEQQSQQWVQQLKQQRVSWFQRCDRILQHGRVKVSLQHCQPFDLLNQNQESLSLISDMLILTKQPYTKSITLHVKKK